MNFCGGTEATDLTGGEGRAGEPAQTTSALKVRTT